MRLKNFLILIDKYLFRNIIASFIVKFDERQLNKDLPHSFTVRYTNQGNYFAELCDQYGSDKGGKGSNLYYPWPPHTYADFYSLLFSDSRTYVKKVYENGIGTNNPKLPSNMTSSGKPGASLRVLRDYFPNASIVGSDIDESILFQDKRISTFWVDQTSKESIIKFWNICKEDNFDIIIDDGLHTFTAGSNLFTNSIEKLANSGTYIIEDVVLKDLFKYKKFFEETNYIVNFISLNRPKQDNRYDNLIVIKKQI